MEHSSFAPFSWERTIWTARPWPRRGGTAYVLTDLRLVVVTAAEVGDSDLHFEHLRGLVADALVPAVGG